MEESEQERQESFSAMAAAARSIWGPDCAVEVTSTGIHLMGIGGGGEQDLLVTRLGQTYVEELIVKPQEGDEYLRRNYNDTFSSRVRSNLLRGRADALLKKGEYRTAAGMFLSAAESRCRTTLPPRRVHTRIYQRLEMAWGVEDVVACFTGAAKAFMATGDHAQALFWLQENLNVYRNARSVLRKDSPLFEWYFFHQQSPQHFLQYSRMHKAFSDVYLKLGNTGAASYYLFQAQVCLQDVPPRLSNKEQKLLHMEVSKAILDIAGYHHPEPSLTSRLEVVDECSQIRGSWKRIELRKPGGVTNREGSIVFVHDGYLYTLGGEKFTEGPYYADFWRLDLSKMNAWEPLPRFPVSEQELQVISLARYKITVGTGDNAYCFIGSRDIDYFDIGKKQWKIFNTKFEVDGIPQRWPYAYDRVKEFAMDRIRDKVYVFGGWHQDAHLGCDLLMELDLKHATWRWLSGERSPGRPSFNTPGPRINPCSWVSKDQSKIFYMYGDANRLGATAAGQAHGASTGYDYNDIWSWDISAKQWTKEKFVGNGPSPRTELALVYNPLLEKVITFGGYSPTSPMIPRNAKIALQYSYYADTFMCDIRTPKPASLDRQASAAVLPCAAHKHRRTLDATTHSWRQVLTRGFPTYRAEAHLVFDAKTGKTFLFSGYISWSFLPSLNVGKESCSRSFADIWELRLDLPGGGFDGVDLEEEARTAKAGPWQRCFACGSAGPWKKCGGSCKGRVFFCGSQCLKDGWKEHKEMH